MCMRVYMRYDSAANFLYLRNSMYLYMILIEPSNPLLWAFMIECTFFIITPSWLLSMRRNSTFCSFGCYSFCTCYKQYATIIIIIIIVYRGMSSSEWKYCSLQCTTKNFVWHEWRCGFCISVLPFRYHSIHFSDDLFECWRKEGKLLLNAI